MEPLAYRMKPKTLDDFFGQYEIVGKDKLLYRLIKADRLTSAIFWGEATWLWKNFSCKSYS